MNEHYKEVATYFNGKAEAYDLVDDQLYWVLSDAFYKEVLKRKLGDLLSERGSVNVLDAGAGTGRWTLFLHDLFAERVSLSGLLVDISEEMLVVAARKIAARGLDACYKVRTGNIEELPDVPDASFDLALSFYNVLSFVEHPERAVAEVAKKLKRGGTYVSVVGNTYHALYFSVLTGREQEIERVLRDSHIAFNDLMPPMRCFTPTELRDLYLANGFSGVEVLGGPNFIYPGMEETFVHGQTDDIRTKLSDSDALQRILDAELRYFDREDVVGRGNTLLAIATV